MASKENQRCIGQIKSIISHPIPDMAMAREFIIDYLNKLQQAIDRLELVEKALDKACEELEDLDIVCRDYASLNIKNKNQWKEYLLKESEKENGK